MEYVVHRCVMQFLRGPPKALWNTISGERRIKRVVYVNFERNQQIPENQMKEIWKKANGDSRI